MVYAQALVADDGINRLADLQTADTVLFVSRLGHTPGCP